MKKEECFEKYPLEIVLISNFVSIVVYLIGAFIVYQIGIIWLVLYLIFILVLEFRLMSRHCVDCYYYGKTCAFGKGRISGMFFKKGNRKSFCKGQMTWKDLIPDLLVSLIPMVVGIVLLVIDFSWSILGLIIALIVLTSVGNSFVRSRLACRYCKQRRIGCPAQKLFEKKN
jgi:hypothetical protein